MPIFDLLKGYSSSRVYRAQAEAMRANAADLRALAEQNYDAYLKAGNVNADAVLKVGEANALAIERATARNMHMYALQADEDRRRFVINQKITAGAIRAPVGAAGIQINTGSPREYLVDQVKLSIRERRFGDIKTYWTLRNMFEEGEDRAYVTRLTAEQQARVIQTNASIQAEMSLADAERQAKAMERGASVASKTASAIMTNAALDAIASVVGGMNFNTAGTTGNYGMGSGMGPDTWGNVSTFNAWGPGAAVGGGRW